MELQHYLLGNDALPVPPMPGDCAPAAGLLARCTFNRTVTLPDGKGAKQTITEATVITITIGGR